ncbi:minor capsid protein [Streptomyces alfalfae]|uniref:minor capsid protein n=1 Tax=Streptomyces alfalfae TaxID=1642299 RepID=UPI00281185FC|nr:minor capsid protein [Streptomyces alfalfae]
MGYTGDLLGGVAALMQSAGLAVFRPSGTYTPTELGITFGALPSTPNRAIAITAYPVEDTSFSDAVTALQIRIRGERDPRPVDDLADDLFDLLHGREQEWIGGVYVALIWRQSQAPLGPDEAGRMELAANYYARTTRPSPHLDE